MRYVVFIMLLYVSTDVHGQSEYLNPDVPLSNSMGSFVFIHIVSSQERDTVDANIGETIGKIEKYPAKLSEKFDNEISLSMSYYDKKDFKNAKRILEEALTSESSNPFILNAYARACYNIDKSKSYMIYKNLIEQLDSTYNNSNSRTVVDIWFREAYWKLGTLYMDSKEWDKAYYEISRFVLSIQDVKSQRVYIQALEYLTECTFVTYKDNTAIYLAKRVLHYDPKNKYAIEVLKIIGK